MYENKNKVADNINGKLYMQRRDFVAAMGMTEEGIAEVVTSDTFKVSGALAAIDFFRTERGYKMVITILIMISIATLLIISIISSFIGCNKTNAGILLFVVVLYISMYFRDFLKYVLMLKAGFRNGWFIISSGGPNLINVTIFSCITILLMICILLSIKKKNRLNMVLLIVTLILFLSINWMNMYVLWMCITDELMRSVVF